MQTQRGHHERAWDPLRKVAHFSTRLFNQLSIYDLRGLHGHEGHCVRHAIRRMHLVDWRGRMELVAARPIALLDGAHNLHATQKLVASLKLHFPLRRLRMIVSMNRDKELAEQWGLLEQAAFRIYPTRSTHARAWDEERMRM